MKLINLALVLVLLASAVSAQFVEDFSISSEPTLQTFQGTPADSHYLITNTGNVASGYTVSVVDSDAASWVKLGPLSFSLQPGQQQIVLLHLDVPRDAAVGRYDLQTVFTTTLGTTLVSDQDVRVDVPHNIDLEAPESKEIKPCGTATYPITIYNTGAFAETFDLSVSKNLASVATFTDDNVVVGAGKNAIVTLTIKPDDCTVSGDKEFSVFGIAESTNAKAELDLFLTIQNPFIPSIAIDDARLTIESGTFNATIVNTGDTKATYKFALDGPDFLKVTPTLTLESGAEGTIVFTSTPDEEVAQQKYPVTLKTSVEGINYEQDFVLTVKDLSWFERNPWLTAGLTVVLIILLIVGVILLQRWIAYTKTDEYQKNKSEAARVAAEVKAQREAEKAELAKEKAKAKAAAEKQREADRKAKEIAKAAAIKAKAQAKFDNAVAKEREAAKKEAERELKATNVLVAKESLQGDTATKPGKTGWWIALLLLLLVLAVVGYGFRTYLIANLFASLAGIITLVVVIILFLFYKKFFGAKRVTQEWTALKARRENEFETGWKHGLGQLWIRVKEVVPNVKLTLVASRSNPTLMAPEGVVYQYLSLRPEGLNEDLVERQRFIFRVSRRWLENNDVSEGNVKLMKYTDDWKGIGTEKVRSDAKWVYYKAETVGLDNFAIVGKSRTEKQTHSGLAPGWWYVIFGAIILLALFGGAWYLATAGSEGTIPVPPSGVGIPPQVWDEDTKLSIDLKQYFVDPDGDSLTFTNTPVQNIVVTISGMEATLTPEKDWFGTRNITFSATDGKGGKVTSNNVSLTVRDVAEPTFWTNLWNGIQHYAGYIVVGIVLLVVLIAILEYRKSFVKA